MPKPKKYSKSNLRQDSQDPFVQQYLSLIRHVETGDTAFKPSAYNPILGAQGAYQFLPTTRDEIRDVWGVDAYSQNRLEADMAATALMRRKSKEALESVKKGQFSEADKTYKSTWTGLPGGNEPNVQTKNVPKLRPDFKPTPGYGSNLEIRPTPVPSRYYNGGWLYPTNTAFPKYADGGGVEPYYTSNPNDPRIQAYEDSSYIANRSIERQKYYEDVIIPIFYKEGNKAASDLLTSRYPEYLDNNHKFNQALDRLGRLNNKAPFATGFNPLHMPQNRYDPNSFQFGYSVYQRPNQKVIYKPKETTKSVEFKKANQIYKKPVNKPAFVPQETPTDSLVSTPIIPAPKKEVEYIWMPDGTKRSKADFEKQYGRAVTAREFEKKADGGTVEMSSPLNVPQGYFLNPGQSRIQPKVYYPGYTPGQNAAKGTAEQDYTLESMFMPVPKIAGAFKGVNTATKISERSAPVLNKAEKLLKAAQKEEKLNAQAAKSLAKDYEQRMFDTKIYQQYRKEFFKNYAQAAKEAKNMGKTTDEVLFKKYGYTPYHKHFYTAPDQSMHYAGVGDKADTWNMGAYAAQDYESQQPFWYMSDWTKQNIIPAAQKAERYNKQVLDQMKLSPYKVEEFSPSIMNKKGGKVTWQIID